MPFLALNGITVPVRIGDASRELLEIGERTRARSGVSRMQRIVTKRLHKFRTPPQTAADALAFTGLIQGDGHVWISGGLTSYSSKGLRSSAVVGTVAFNAPSVVKFSASVLSLSGGGALASISYQPEVGTDWTVMVWRTTNNGSSWTHHIVRSDGTKFVNGVSSGAATSWLTVSAPNLTLSDTSSPTPVKYDDLVFLPFLVPASWAPTIAARTSGWPLIPTLTATGDGLAGTTQSVHGSVVSLDLVQGSGVSNLHSLSFELYEV